MLTHVAMGCERLTVRYMMYPINSVLEAVHSTSRINPVYHGLSHIKMTYLLTDVLSIATAFMSVLVITAQSPITSIIYLIGVFVLASCYLSCIGLTYVGLTYLVVYVGAVAVLFLFVVMMFNVQHVGVYGLELTQGMPLGALLACIFLLEVMSVLPSLTVYLGAKLQSLAYTINAIVLGVNANTSAVADTSVSMVYAEQAPDSAFVYLSQVQSLGLTLYSHGSLWLIMVGLILLLAMLGPITLCLRINK